MMRAPEAEGTLDMEFTHTTLTPQRGHIVEKRVRTPGRFRGKRA
jgi:hypothetical protein